MTIEKNGFRVGEAVYWIHLKRSASGYGQHVLIYTRANILSLTEQSVQISKRQYIPYQAVHKIDTIRTLDIPGQDGKNRTVIADLVRMCSYNGGNYSVEWVDFDRGNTVILFSSY